MPDVHPLDALETTNRSLHRAQTESFAFRLHDGAVLVRNLTYENPSEHEYRVTIDDGVPVDCTCPAEATFAPACKHRVAVAIRDAVRESATRMQVAADGGPVDAATHARDSTQTPEPAADDSAPKECDCDDLPDGSPCWPCYRDGRATFSD
jgi:hypothetical protein